MCYVSGQFVGSRLSIAIGSAATGVGDYVYVPRLLPSSKGDYFIIQHCHTYVGVLIAQLSPFSNKWVFINLQ